MRKLPTLREWSAALAAVDVLAVLCWAWLGQVPAPEKFAGMVAVAVIAYALFRLPRLSALRNRSSPPAGSS